MPVTRKSSTLFVCGTAGEWLNGVMLDVHEIRRQNLRDLKAEKGSGELLERLDMQKQQLSMYIGRRPVRNIGDDVARRIEREFRLPHGWLDNLHYPPHVQQLLDVASQTDIATIKAVLQILRIRENLPHTDDSLSYLAETVSAQGREEDVQQNPETATMNRLQKRPTKETTHEVQLSTPSKQRARRKR